MEEAVIIQEEYFDGFLSLYFKQIPLNLKLNPSTFPTNLPFNLYVKDWFHIIFGMDDLDENQSLGLTCNWGAKDSLVNITVAGLEGNIALKCNLYTDSIKPQNLLNFWFTLQVVSKPTLMKLVGGTYIKFGLVGVQVTEYEDDQPGNVVDKYMISRIIAAAQQLAPQEIPFFDKRLDTMEHITLGFEDHYIKFSGDLL